MSKYRRWKPDEDRLLVKLYNRKTLKELADIFNRKSDKVCRRAIRLGIKKDKASISKAISKTTKITFQKGRNHRGQNNPRWSGGIINSYGYINKWTKDRGYVGLHRLVIEKQLGRKLKEAEVVHHIDHNPLNNEIKNLALCKNESEHKTKYHLEECMENISKTPSHKKHNERKNGCKYSSH